MARDSTFGTETVLSKTLDYIAFLKGDGSGGYENKKITIGDLLRFDYTNPLLISGNYVWFDATNFLFRYDSTAPSAETDGSPISAGIYNVVEDTTPQLGGDLDLNGNVITGLEIGTDVQAYDAETAKKDEVSTFVGLRATEDLNINGDYVSNERFSIVGRLLANNAQAQLMRIQSDVAPELALSNLYGIIFLPTIADSAFDITNLYGMFSRLGSDADYTGQVTNAKIIKAAVPTWNSANKPTTLRGFEMDDLTGVGAGTTHGLFLFGTTMEHYIGGDLGLNTTTPDEKLHVVGNIKVEGDIIGHVIGTDIQAHSDTLDNIDTDWSVDTGGRVGVNSGFSSVYGYIFGSGSNKNNSGAAWNLDMFPDTTFQVFRLVPTIALRDDLTGTSYANNNNTLFEESDVDGLSYDINNFTGYFMKAQYQGVYEGNLSAFRAFHNAAPTHNGTPANPVTIDNYRSFESSRITDSDISVDTIQAIVLNHEDGDGVTNEWNVYAVGTAKNYMEGSLGLGIANPTHKLEVDGIGEFYDGIITGSFTVATLPSAIAAGIIYVSDETGGAVLAFSDGTDWRRVTDRAVVS